MNPRSSFPFAILSKSESALEENTQQFRSPGKKLEGFPKRNRILKSADYSAIYRQGRRKSGKFLQMIFQPNGLTHSRWGISVGKKIGKAVQRNLYKRRIREVLRRHHLPCGECWDIVIHPRAGARIPEFGELKEEIQRLLAALYAPGPQKKL